MKLSIASRRSISHPNAPKFTAPLPVSRCQVRRDTARLPRWCMALAGMLLLNCVNTAHASATVAKIAEGGYDTFFIKSDGTLWSMGWHNYGEIGDGTGSTHPASVQVSGGTNVAAIAASSTHAVFVKTDGTLWAVGENSGDLGDGTWDNRSIPVPVIGGTNVAAVAAGADHTIFLKTDGTLWAMGANSHGQLGDGTTTSRNTPVPVSGGTNVASIAAGGFHTVFAKTDGTLWAVGQNTDGQLGDGTTTDRLIPVPVSKGSDVTAVVGGAFHTVFLKTDGTLWTMGANSYGQLGDGTTISRSTPAQVSGIAHVAAVAAGGSHTVFLKADNTLWAMGENFFGELGDGTTTDRHTPVQVIGGTNVTAIAAGGATTVFLKNNGRIWGTGSNSAGELSGINPDSVTTPALINLSISLTPIGSKTVGLGTTLSFTISATDSNNDTLTYSATNLPSGATFTPTTQTFSWSPLTLVRPYPAVTFNVTDGFVTVSETIMVFVTDITPPSIPTHLSGSAASSTAVLLTWTPSTDNVGVNLYRVYRNGVSIGDTLSPSYSDTFLKPGTTYSYTVTAEDLAGNVSAQSAAVSVKLEFTGAQTRNVTDANTLTTALAEAVANPSATFTINLAAGTYTVGSTPLPDLSISGTTIQGPLSEPYAIIDGTGLSGGVVFNVTASNVTLSGLTFKNVATHAITIQPHADSGSILGCSFYGTGATAAILGRGCANWMVLLNDIYDIAGTTAMAEPAIYFHEGVTNLAVSNNLLQDCDRGIGFGSGATENNGSGWIFNNMISDTRTTGNFGPGISVASIASSGVSIDNNTVYQAGGYANAIEYNNNTATITLRNNLTNKAIKGSNSPSVIAATNNANAVAAWFKDPSDCDLRLTSAISGVVNAGTTINGLTIDIEGDPRPTGSAFDIGADEYTGPASPVDPSSGGTGSTGSSSGSNKGGGAPTGWFFGALAAVAMARKVLNRDRNQS